MYEFSIWWCIFIFGVGSSVVCSTVSGNAKASISGNRQQESSHAFLCSLNNLKRLFKFLYRGHTEHKKHMRKIIVPSALGVVLAFFVIFNLVSHDKIQIELTPYKNVVVVPDTVVLNVYMENSGSMDGYMCPGSMLKDAVYDYVSDVKKETNICNLYYINSQVIPYNGSLDSYIKDLTPASFAKAGGNKSNTDLRQIFKDIIKYHNANSVSIFVSDCILDIPENAIDFFGNCQVSLKNIFNEALAKYPSIGVEIVKLESTFDGYWYCGNNKVKLSGVKRPYYMWIIGDVNILAKINKKASVSDVIHGIKEYCAFSPIDNLPFDIDKKTYQANNSINVEMCVDMGTTLQSELTIKNIGSYKVTTPSQVIVSNVSAITNSANPYSHVINLQITNPQSINSEVVNLVYPQFPSWIENSNDDTGKDVLKNIDKTTGIKYLIKGVAEAYKNHTTCGNFEFQLKNK